MSEVNVLILDAAAFVSIENHFNVESFPVHLLVKT